MSEDADPMDELCGGCQEQLDRLTKERDEARAERDQFGDQCREAMTMWNRADLERIALRAAIEPTEATMQHIRGSLRDMCNWSDPLIEAILAAIAVRAKGEG